MSMHSVLSCDRVREIDRTAINELRMPGLLLMENAGHEIVQLMLKRGVQGPVLVACGAGNNGGDGFVIARHLDQLGIEVVVGLAVDPERIQGDARANLNWLSETDVRLHRLDSPSRSTWRSLPDRPDWIIDALLGTGVQGPPRVPIADVIERLNHFPARRLAVDIPSGLNGDTGQPSTPTFRADLTGTFVCAKPGLIRTEAQPYVGCLEVLPIGLPRRWLARFGPHPGSRGPTASYDE